MTKPGGNGSADGNGVPSFIGKDKVKNRRQLLAARILENPDGDLDVNKLASEFHVSRRTIQRDLESPEVVSAYDRTIEENIDVTLLQAAWGNIRRDIIEGKNTDRSVWLVEHRSKTAHTERMFEAFQTRLAQAMAESFDQPLSEIDFNEKVTVKTIPPSTGLPN